MSTIRSSYDPDKTLGQLAAEQADRLVARAKEGTIDESHPYSSNIRTIHEYILAIGGPGASVTFEVDSDGEVLAGWYTFWETDGEARVELSLNDAMLTWEALHRSA